MPILAKDIMTTDIITLNAGMTCQQAMVVLKEANISGAPVTNELGEILGVVSLKDLLPDNDQWIPISFYDAIETGQWVRTRLEVSDEPLDTVMSNFIYTVEPEQPIESVANLMYTHNIHRVMVVANNQLTGIISTLDILKAIALSSASMPSLASA